MPSRAADLDEAAARPLMSSSTTTTTLASQSNNASQRDHQQQQQHYHQNGGDRGGGGGGGGGGGAAIRLNNLGKNVSPTDGVYADNANVLFVDADEEVGTGNRISINEKTTSLIRGNDNDTEAGNHFASNNLAGSKKQRQAMLAAAAAASNGSGGNNGNGSDDDGGDHDNINRSALQQQLAIKKEPNLILTLKLVAIFSTLYFFMWSSSLLSQAFNLASYHYAGHFIRTSGFLQNPLIGLMVGVITTVVFQSSGAVTSVLVTIVGSGVLTVRQSIPIIMGANLGTSVTNTVVSLVVYRKKQNFEIAMTAGIVHDMYNMMSVVFMLPIELLFHPLERLSFWMLNLFGTNSRTEIGQVQFLSHLVKPLVDLIIVIDKSQTANLDPNVIVPSNKSLIKKCCNEERIGDKFICHKYCFSLFSYLDFSDNVVCVLLLIMAMVTLFTCLVFVVKVTKSLLGGRLSNWVANLAGREYKFPYSMFVGYLFILVGLVITVILHSSGVFTSMLVPLAGGDVLNLMQVYELTLGSNVGTTTTGIFAALSAQSKYPIETLQVALCHFLFNVAGILMFYSFPHTTLPIWASKKFGMYSAQNLWFSIIYLIIVFLVAPSLTMAIYLLTT